MKLNECFVFCDFSALKRQMKQQQKDEEKAKKAAETTQHQPPAKATAAAAENDDQDIDPNVGSRGKRERQLCIVVD